MKKLDIDDVKKKSAMFSVFQSALKSILDFEYKKDENGDIDWEFTCRGMKTYARLCLDFCSYYLNENIGGKNE